METRDNWQAAENESSQCNFKWAQISKFINQRIRFQTEATKSKVKNIVEPLRTPQLNNQ